MKKEITTIKISKLVVEELFALKVHPRQAYEEVVVKLLAFYNKKLGGEIKEGPRVISEREITTMKISKEIVEQLSALKVHPRQAYEEVIVKLLDYYKNGNP